MMTQLAQNAAVSTDGGDIEPDLLADTQSYLEARCWGMPPIPRLVEAWERFYRSYDPLIRRCVAGYPMTEEDRFDCVQEAWTEVIARLGRFRYDPRRGRLRTWLHALARNKAVDVIRRRHRHPVERLSGEAEGSLPGRDPDPAEDYVRRCERDMVRGAICQLSKKIHQCSYRVVYLRWIEGRTVPEIAVALGLTPQQVHFRHHRAMRKFRRLMETSR